MRVVDLFAGAGLFSAAFQLEGFSLMRAIEIDDVAAESYRLNLGEHVEVGDVGSSDTGDSCDVLVMGPPCQGFSTLGRRNPDDPRNELTLEAVRWAKALTPRVIVIENVETFLDHPVWRKMAKGLDVLGYEIAAHVIDAIDMGVPQRRKRSFTIASMIGLPRIRPIHAPQVRTVREAFVGLPKSPDGVNHHYAPTPSDLALARMQVIKPGGDRRDVIKLRPDLTPPSWWSLGNNATGAWGRLHWDAPSHTLRTSLQNPSKGRHIHPDQHRVISLREACRLHTIPDSWQFSGFPTQVARQIGNSVPIMMGRAVARSVMELA